MLNFDRSTVNHGTQNIQNGCHQCLSDSCRVHQIRFRPGCAPGPTGGAYSAPSALLAMGPILLAGGVAQLLGRRSVAGGLSLIYA